MRPFLWVGGVWLVGAIVWFFGWWWYLARQFKKGTLTSSAVPPIPLAAPIWPFMAWLFLQDWYAERIRPRFCKHEWQHAGIGDYCPKCRNFRCTL